MQPVDRWKRELDQSLSRLPPSKPGREAAALRDFFAASFRGLPRDFLDSLLEGLEDRLAADREGELARCATLGSILLMDYDEGTLADEDWDRLREAFSDSGGELDLELLTYAMQLVLDRGRF